MEILGVSILVVGIIICMTVWLLKKEELPKREASNQIDNELKKMEFTHKLELERDRHKMQLELELKQFEVKKIELERSFELRKLELEMSKTKLEMEAESTIKKIVTNVDIVKTEADRDVEIKKAEIGIMKEIDTVDFRKEEMRLTFDLEAKKIGQETRSSGLPFFRSSRYPNSSRW